MAALIQRRLLYYLSPSLLTFFCCLFSPNFERCRFGTAFLFNYRIRHNEYVARSHSKTMNDAWNALYRFLLPCMIAISLCPSTAQPAYLDAYPVVSVTSSLASTQEVLQEVIQEEGLIPGQVTHISDMMARTGLALGKRQGIYHDAVIVQFCSAQIAWLMAEEDPRQISHCPLAITLYVLPRQGETTYISYRSPGNDSPAKVKASELLKRIILTTQQRLTTTSHP